MNVSTGNGAVAIMNPVTEEKSIPGLALRKHLSSSGAEER
jgi:hypothetical protein